MDEEGRGEGFDKASAELFEALGHPIRMEILDSLRDGPVSFSELKRRTHIRSSGHLIFHLGKLGRLVVTTPEGDYVVSSEGREALVLADRIRRQWDRPRADGGRMAPSKRVLAALTMLAVLSISAFALGLANVIPARQPNYVLVSLDLTLSPNATKGFSVTNSAPLAVMSLRIEANGTDLFSFSSLQVAPSVKTELSDQPLKDYEFKYGMTYNFTAVVGMEDGRVLSDSVLVGLQEPSQDSKGYSFGVNFRLNLP